jgi:hypothetical protein
LVHDNYSFSTVPSNRYLGANDGVSALFLMNVDFDGYAGGPLRVEFDVVSLGATAIEVLAVDPNGGPDIPVYSALINSLPPAQTITLPATSRASFITSLPPLNDLGLIFRAEAVQPSSPAFGLDNVRLASIPEPSAAILAGLATITAAVRALWRLG